MCLLSELARRRLFPFECVNKWERAKNDMQMTARMNAEAYVQSNTKDDKNDD